MRPYYEHAGITIYHGDCREVLPSVSCDALITDPPYGVGFTGKRTKHSDHSGGDSYQDSDDYFNGVVLPAIRLALSRATCGAIFSGVRKLQEYPAAADIGAIVCPNGGGRAPWGFGCLHPILFYGPNPYLAAAKGSRPTATAIWHPGMHVTGEKFNHPCPKPLAFMEWAVTTASLEGQSVLDPFMGSGTTLVAAKNNLRRAIGIEIEERYCEIAAKRLSQEVLFPAEVA